MLPCSNESAPKIVPIDDGRLADQQAGAVDLVFDLGGNSVLGDSLRIVRPRGRVCKLGFLGRLEPVAGVNPIADLPSGVQFSFYGGAFVLGTSQSPAYVPLTEMIGKAEYGLYQAKPAWVFGFDDIVEAHQAMESGLAGGKMTVPVNDFLISVEDAFGLNLAEADYASCSAPGRTPRPRRRLPTGPTASARPGTSCSTVLWPGTPSRKRSGR